jgi:hypothetical protein
MAHHLLCDAPSSRRRMCRQGSLQPQGVVAVWGIIFMCILPTLEGWVYRVSYTWASMGYTGHMGHSHIYTLTSPQKYGLPVSGVQDWPTKKETHTQGPPQPELATGYVETRPELREGRRRKTLGEDVSKLGGGRYMENLNISDSHPVTNEVQVNLTCFVR